MFDSVTPVLVVIVMGMDCVEVVFADDLEVVISGTRFTVLLISAADCVIIVTVVGVNVEDSVLTVEEDMCVVVVACTCCNSIDKRKDGYIISLCLHLELHK